MMTREKAEYVFVGGGPASLCGIATLLGQGLSYEKIIWIDSGGFNVGDFGSILSKRYTHHASC